MGLNNNYYQTPFRTFRHFNTIYQIVSYSKPILVPDYHRRKKRYFIGLDIVENMPLSFSFKPRPQAVSHGRLGIELKDVTWQECCGVKIESE